MRSTADSARNNAPSDKNGLYGSSLAKYSCKSSCDVYSDSISASTSSGFPKIERRNSGFRLLPARDFPSRSSALSKAPRNTPSSRPSRQQAARRACFSEFSFDFRPVFRLFFLYYIKKTAKSQSYERPSIRLSASKMSSSGAKELIRTYPSPPKPHPGVTAIPYFSRK